jgi:uncharacterized protein YdaU (DUF1376 family)
MNYYPHHIGDFDRATRHLTRVERSVYRDLIDVYYDTERPLTLDQKALCRLIIARTNEEATAVAQVLSEFFDETPTGWYHARCEEEIAHFRANKGQKAEAGRKSAAARALRKQQAINGCSTGVEQTSNGAPTNQEPGTNNQEPGTTTPTPSDVCGPSTDDHLADGFDDFWEAWPSHHRKADRAKCLKYWRAENLHQCAAPVVASVEAWKQSAQWTKDGGEYIPAPLPWLRKRVFEAPAPAAASAVLPFNRQVAQEQRNQDAVDQWLASQQGVVYEAE